MKLEGSHKLSVKKEIVWQALNNPDILNKCIPGCESFKKESDTIFTVAATNQIGPMNATFSGTVTLSNIRKNQSYTITGEGQSPVGFANGTADVKLIEENGSTILRYEVNANIGGKIAQLGSRLIDGVAKKMSDYFFGRFADIVAPMTEVEAKATGEIIAKKRVEEVKSNFLSRYVYSAIFVLILLIVAIIYFVSR
jgi:hypothetical protein